MKKTALLLFVVLLAGSLSAQNDRAAFGLKGNVSKVIQNGDVLSLGGFWEGSDLEFSQNGRLSKIGGKTIKTEHSENEGDYFTVEIGDEMFSVNLVFWRNAQKRISTYYFDDGESLGDDTIIYDNKGRVDKIKTSVYIESGYNPDTGKMEEGRTVEAGYTQYFYDENSNVVKVIHHDIESKQTITATYNYRFFDPSGNWLIRVVNCDTYGVKNQVEKRTIEYY